MTLARCIYIDRKKEGQKATGRERVREGVRIPTVCKVPVNGKLWNRGTWCTGRPYFSSRVFTFLKTRFCFGRVFLLFVLRLLNDKIQYRRVVLRRTGKCKWVFFRSVMFVWVGIRLIVHRLA